MQLKIKRMHENARIISKGRPGDACYDLFPLESGTIPPLGSVLLKLGFATEFPDGYVALIQDRSGTGVKGIMRRAGVIDSNYRGEWGVCLFNSSDQPIEYTPGKAIAQVLFTVAIWAEIEVVDDLGQSHRGEAWQGSSDARQ